MKRQKDVRTYIFPWVLFTATSFFFYAIEEYSGYLYVFEQFLTMCKYFSYLYAVILLTEYVSYRLAHPGEKKKKDKKRKSSLHARKKASPEAESVQQTSAEGTTESETAPIDVARKRKKHTLGEEQIQRLLLAVHIGAVLYLLIRLARVQFPEFYISTISGNGTGIVFIGICLVAAIVYIVSGVSLEAWLGAIISIFIIKAGIDMLRETISEILGERVDPHQAKAIRATVNQCPEVSGTYDLVIHNYGPSTFVGSLHIEVPESMTAAEIDRLSRAITEKIYEEHGIIMTGISVYSRNTADEDAVRIRREITEMVMEDPAVLELHGFYLDDMRMEIQFDIIINFDYADREERYRKIQEKVQSRYPDYKVSIVLDLDISD